MTSPTPPLSRKGFRVAIICASPLEAGYVQSVFDKCWDDEGKQYDKAPGDQNAYTTGVIGRHNVVLAHMPGMGTNSASAVAASLRFSFPAIQLALIVGICGVVPIIEGTKEEILLGDIIVSTAVIHYDFGGRYDHGFKRKTAIEDSLGRANPELRALIAKLKTRPNLKKLKNQLGIHLTRLQVDTPEARYPGGTLDRCYEPSYIHQHRAANETCDKCEAAIGICSKSCDELQCQTSKLILRRRLNHQAPLNTGTVPKYTPSVYFGRFGSANTVMKSGIERDGIAKTDGVIAFEMESAGVWDQFPTVVIKGACDYADSHKNKAWQEYAAATAAACMKAFLSEWVTPDQVWEQVEPPEPVFHVPFEQDKHERGFVGRIDELRCLQARLFQSDGRRVTSILGLGGVGKSRLALEIAYQTHLGKPEHSVLWIQATGRLTLEKDLREIGKKLGIPGIEDEKADVKDLVKQRLSDPSLGKWLLILDNADDEMLWTKKFASATDKITLLGCLPRTTNGSILVTTRSRQVAVDLAASGIIELPRMSSDEAYQMFVGGLLQSCDPALDRIDILLLAEKLTCLPLAIVQAISYLRMTQRPIKTYLELLEKPEAEAIRLLSKDFEDPSRYPDANNAVAKAWLVSFNNIRRDNPLAATYLSYMACLHEKNIPRSLLPDVASELDVIDAIAVLQGYSFISRQTGTSSISSLNELYDMHRLVQLATRNWLTMESQLESYTKACISRVMQLFPVGDYRNKEIWSVYLPHGYRLCADESVKDLPDRYSLLEKIGICILEDGKYHDAVEIHTDVLKWRERQEGLPDQTIRDAYYYLGRALRFQGNWVAAKEYLQQALNRDKQTLGQEHPRTLNSQFKVVQTYLGQGQYQQAEELLIPLIGKMSRIFGPEHSQTLQIQTDLAATYMYQNRLKEAEELNLQVLKRRSRILGSEHPDTLFSQSNLAATYMYQNRWKEAEELNLQVLKRRSRILDPEHPNTLTAMNNLAINLANQERLGEAISLMAQCVQRSIEVLTAEHDQTKQRQEVLQSMQNQAHDTATLLSSSSSRVGSATPALEERADGGQYEIAQDNAYPDQTCSQETDQNGEPVKTKPGASKSLKGKLKRPFPE